MYNTTIESYSNFLYKYGILIVLILLEDFQEKEYYEECEKIVKAIEAEEIKLNQTLPRKLDEETIDRIIFENEKCNFTIHQKPHYIFYAVHTLLNEIHSL